MEQHSFENEILYLHILYFIFKGLIFYYPFSLFCLTVKLRAYTCTYILYKAAFHLTFVPRNAASTNK